MHPTFLPAPLRTAVASSRRTPHRARPHHPLRRQLRLVLRSSHDALSNRQRTMTTHRRAALLAVVAALATVGASMPAAAGTYTVSGTCGAWSSFNDQPARLASYPACPHLIARNVIGNFTTRRAEPGAGWRFDVPAGTSLEEIRLDAYITGGRSWSSEVRIHGGPGQGNVSQVMALCVADDNCGKDPAYTTGGGLTGAIIARVWCSDNDGCPNDGPRPRASVDIAGSAITLNDPTPPNVGIAPGGSLTSEGWHGGTRTLAIAASDNTGIRAVRALVDGDSRYSSTNALPCDFGRPVPCSDHGSAPVTVDLRGLPDGQHAVAAQAEDASGNPATTAPATINVDNTPPLAPHRARLTGGRVWRSSNNFTVVWRNPAQLHAPIAGANWRLCPQGAPDTSSACRTGTLASADLNRLALQVPGPGAWRMRLWLYDAAGNSAEENAVTVTGLGLLAGGKGTTRSFLKAGDRTRKGLKRKTSVALGRKLKIVGRLSAGKRRRGIRRKLLVYRRVSVQGAGYRLVDRIRTTRRGRFVYRAGRGPSRRLLFVYPGGGGTAGRIAKVQVRVRAKLRIRADRKRLDNGEAVTLSGRLRGGKIPPAGALLELQVFTRGSWRPFAAPRTDRRGRWRYAYRFETIAGNVKFRFRAVLRKQPTYPFTAKSRAIAVRVRGL